MIGVVSWAISMPIFVLAARICPKGMEATMYSVILGFLILGWCVGAQLGALLTWALGITQDNLDNFWILVLICHASSLLPLTFIGACLEEVEREGVGGRAGHEWGKQEEGVGREGELVSGTEEKEQSGGKSQREGELALGAVPPSSAAIPVDNFEAMV